VDKAELEYNNSIWERGKKNWREIQHT